MKISTNGTTRLAVTVDASDVLKKLKIGMGLADIHGAAYSLTNHKNKRGIYKIEDISHHGSPVWEYMLITDSERDIKAYECINYLLEYLEEKAKN